MPVAGQPLREEPFTGPADVAGRLVRPLRVPDDVHDLRKVDRRQSPAVHQQVVGRQVAVREAVLGQRAQCRSELVPEITEFVRRGAQLGQSFPTG